MTTGSSTLKQNLPRALQVKNAGNGVPQFLLALQSFLAHLLHECVGSQRCAQDFHSPWAPHLRPKLLHSGWQLLLQSANPRANHTMRTMPPSQVYCRAHDEGVWETAKRLLGHVPAEDEEEARNISTLPMRMGGLGLRSAERCGGRPAHDCRT